MAKRYLNSREKDDLAVLMAFQNYMNKKATTLEENNMPKQQIYVAKMARSYARKLYEYIIEPLDSQIKAKTIIEAKLMHVVTLFTDQAKKEYKEILALDSITPVKTDDLLTMGDAIKERICGECEEPGENTHLCTLRKIMLDYNIEVLNPYAPEGVCPYQSFTNNSAFGVALAKAKERKR